MGSLIESVKVEFSKIKDPKKRSKFSITDCLLSALGMFYLKMPSLLKFVNAAKEPNNPIVRNLMNLYGVSKVPSDTNLRVRLDDIEIGNTFQYAIDGLISKLQRSKVLEDFRGYKDHYIVAIDGTGYFSSDEIHCENCCIKEHKDGSVSYYHQVLAAVMVSPGRKEALPVGIEPIIKQDGTIKNDCEINAAKRLLRRIRKSHPNLKMVVVMDALYANGPLIKLIEELNLKYIINAKNLPHMYKKFETSEKIVKHEVKTDKKEGKYKFANDLELNATHPDIKVNYVEYNELVYKKKYKIREMISEPSDDRFPRRTDVVVYHGAAYFKHNETKKLTKLNLPNFTQEVNLRNIKKYINSIKDDSLVLQGLGSPAKNFFGSWITNLPLSTENIALIVECARERWSIENETFNTLKNLGYNFEHNYGHGYKNLSIVLCFMMFIAFLIDQIGSYCSYYFKEARKKVYANIALWEKIRIVFTNHEFGSWDEFYIELINLLSHKNKLSLAPPGD